jgi:hypothetical protein
MAYTKPVKFSVTNTYGNSPEGEDDVYTVKEFLAHCDNGSFIDYDGYVYDETIYVEPSNALTTIPKDATHIVWYNR